MVPAATATLKLTRRLVAVLSSLSGLPLLCAACVPAANAPPAGPAQASPNGSPTVAQPGPPSTHGPVSSGNPSAEELCAGHRCPEGTYCTSGMSPRGPFAECKPLIQSVPGRRFASLSPLLSTVWG